MNDVIVSVRMPKGLTEELRGLIERNHFMDMSEAIRSIVRKHYLKARTSGFEKGSLLARLKQMMEEQDESQ